MASLAIAALTDVLIVSAFCCRQASYKIKHWVSFPGTCSLKQYGWKIFSWKCGGVQDMSKTGLHRAMFMFLIQWLTHYFTEHENHSYSNCVFFSPVRSTNFASKSIFQTSEIVSSFMGWSTMWRTIRKLTEQCHFINAHSCDLHLCWEHAFPVTAQT